MASANRVNTEQIYRDAKKLKADLEECLTYIRSCSVGSFAVSGQLQGASDPCIQLKDGSRINLPLDEFSAQRIIGASRQLPLDKSKESTIDTNLRKNWELAPAEFQIQNPAWATFMNSIAARVAGGLGVSTSAQSISAKLDKMLLCDNGAMYKPCEEYAWSTLISGRTRTLGRLGSSSGQLVWLRRL